MIIQQLAINLLDTVQYVKIIFASYHGLLQKNIALTLQNRDQTAFI